MNYKLTKDMIRSLASNADVYSRGEAYYRENKILDVDLSSMRSEGIVLAHVMGNYREYLIRLRFEPQDGSLLYYKCNCAADAIWRGACKHVVALLLALQNEKGDLFIRSRMDAVVKKMNASFQERLQDAVSRDLRLSPAFQGASLVKIAPCFQVNDMGQAQLSFSLGVQRQYIIKNIYGFMEAMENRETVSYGKQLSFCHHEAAFDPAAVPWIHLMRMEKEALTAMMGQLSYSSYMSPRTLLSRFLPLSARNFDAFYEICKGRDISFVNENNAGGKETLYVSIEPPGLQYALVPQDEGVTLRARVYGFCFWQGENFWYLLTGNRLYRVTEDYAQTVRSIDQCFAAMERPEINLSGTELPRFLDYVWPELKRHGLADEDSGALVSEIYERFPLETALFMDTDGLDIVCRVQFRYGETELNPLRPADGDLSRDTLGEFKVTQRLLSLGFQPDTERGEYRLSDADKAYDFYFGALENLKNDYELFATDSFTGKSAAVTARASFGLRLEGNLLALSIDTTAYSLAELMESLQSYREKKRYHRLKDGRFLSLESQEMKTVANLVSSLDLHGKDFHDNTVKVPKYRALFLESLAKDSVDMTQDRQFRQLVKDFKLYDEYEADPPESLQPVLRPYQKTGFSWLSVLARHGFGGILADDMGLGKTLQMIALLLSQKEKTDKPSMVVAPTSLVYNWEKEIQRFAPGLKAVVVAGQPERRKELINTAQDADVFITTYDTLKRDIERYEGIAFQNIIADEAQNIKNPATQNAQAVKALQGESRFALTGTPIENSLAELWSIFDFVLPGYLLSPTKFSRIYETPIVKNSDAEAARLLKKQIAPFILRRVKRDVLKELPEKTETVLYADMTEEQQKLYAANLLHARGELDEAVASGVFAKSQIRILAEITRLRQICCHPGLCVAGYEGGSGKLDLTLETVAAAVESGHRILLFSQFTSMLALIIEGLKKRNLSYFYLDGATNAKLRGHMVDRFNHGEKSVFLISLRAGGTGLNLTGADMVIHYDPWWNPAVMDQASDRAHRFGQKRAVQIYNIVARGSIEERILTLQEKKRDLIDNVIEEGGSFLNKMTEEELRELFQPM